MRGVNYIVTAFTGKAVSRLHEIMKNKQAATIDRHIMKIKERSANDPKYDKTSLQHIIIDEASMVTTELLYRLIMQVGNKVAITFIGDCNQLPPIGAGTLMKELMNSYRVPTFYLTQNQRIIPHTGTMKETVKMEEPGSKEFDRCILENANSLIDTKRSRSMPMTYKEGNGFYILEGSKETVKTIVKELKVRECTTDQIMIISPYKAPLEELNRIFQQIYFDDILETDESYVQPTPTGGRLWCIGDRVMMTANNYKINVMNGEQGKVVGIEDAGIKV
jgi:exodeoxyribonuclease V alpha subunit